MRVLVIGGIFGRAEEFRRAINPTPETTLCDGLRDRGVEVATSPHRWLSRSRGADIVHVHHLAKALPYLSLTAGLRPGGLVFTRHGQEEGLSSRRRYSLALVQRQADAVVALSDQEAARIRPAVRGRVVVIRNGIELPDVAPVTRRPDDDRLRLLFVGQLIPLKNVDVLLRALAATRGRMRSTLRVVFHNRQLLPDLRALASQLGLDDIVTFVGPCDRAGLVREYRRADALVLPSSTESLPSVVTESLQCGVPVVASAVGGVAEQVGDAGILVPPGDCGALAAALIALGAKRAELRHAARSRSVVVRAEYGIAGMIDRHLELYETLLRGGPGRRVAGTPGRGAPHA